MKTLAAGAAFHFAPPQARATVLMRVVGYLLLFDLLILPYFPLLVMPLSLPLVLAWAFGRLEVRVDRELRLFVILALCVLCSVAVSLVIRGSQWHAENIKRAGQLLTSFAYYFCFRSVARDRRFEPLPILLAFLVYYTAWVVYFMVLPDQATILQQSIYTSISFLTTRNTVFSRFSYMFADPNTAGYLLAMVGVWVLTLGRLGSFGRVAVVLMVALGVVSSGSRGVLLSVALVALFLIWKTGLLFRYVARFTLAGIIVLGLSVVVFQWYAARDSEGVRVATNSFQNVSSRLFGNENQTVGEMMLEGETSAAGARIPIYRWMVTNLVPLPIGRGYIIVGPAGEFRPHSDIFRLLYSYGFISLFVGLVFLFRDLHKLPFAFPAFMAFAVNTMLDEQKLFAAFLALLALARAELERRRLADSGPKQPRKRIPTRERSHRLRERAA